MSKHQLVHVALYARVSSHDQKQDLERQLNRLKGFAAAKDWQIKREVKEIGSGLNGNRKKLMQLLQDQSIAVLLHKSTTTERSSALGTSFPPTGK